MAQQRQRRSNALTTGRRRGRHACETCPIAGEGQQPWASEMLNGAGCDGMAIDMTEEAIADPEGAGVGTSSNHFGVDHTLGLACMGWVGVQVRQEHVVEGGSSSDQACSALVHLYRVA